MEKSSSNLKYQRKNRKKKLTLSESLHPVVLLVYFAGTATVTMITLNPVLLGISFFGSLFSAGMLIGFRRLFQFLVYSFPMLIIIAAINPVFVHRGETLLFFLNDSPITLEAILYGASASVMIITVFYWFKCFGIAMTSDKVIYLFGKLSPQLALILSMSLGFISKLKRQYARISSVQKSMGIYTSNSITDKILSRFRILSTLVGWALESSVDTADSMNARGYGLPGRSSYSLFRWTRRDVITFTVILSNIALLAVSMAMMDPTNYYPVFTGLRWGRWDIAAYALIAILSNVITAMELYDRIQRNLAINAITTIQKT